MSFPCYFVSSFEAAGQWTRLTNALALYDGLEDLNLPLHKLLELLFHLLVLSCQSTCKIAAKQQSETFMLLFAMFCLATAVPYAVFGAAPELVCRSVLVCPVQLLFDLVFDWIASSKGC